MRFLLKMGFWLALIAFFLPSGGGEASRPDVNYFSAFLGAQEALSDMRGFCERSPTACAAGREVGSFVAARVGDGLAYAYRVAQGQMREEPSILASLDGAPQASLAAQPAPRIAVAASPDPMETAAVAAERVRKAAGLPPFGAPPARAAEAAPVSLADAPLPPAPARLAVPTAAPRP
ncbi:DUF5330 domain-containing protein [Aureimonas populi]|uniref:DUF5330 domain-containing protein n=1 Tax=Aureimonas populi TaxID=1701758 RepID=A0ABW5CJZ9_9HYPH|nr:DUF5330 domain-containing protein [Aureimonas populi]